MPTLRLKSLHHGHIIIEQVPWNSPTSTYADTAKKLAQWLTDGGLHADAVYLLWGEIKKMNERFDLEQGLQGALIKLEREQAATAATTTTTITLQPTGGARRA